MNNCRVMDGDTSGTLILIGGHENKDGDCFVELHFSSRGLDVADCDPDLRLTRSDDAGRR
jgi:hypothetical protein